jgi:hypothetical protein
MRILNLTQHVATLEQIAAGVVEPSDTVKKEVQDLLSFFDGIPDQKTITRRAEQLAAIAADASVVMIGGAPFFMSALERAMFDGGIKAVYAFSVRDSFESTIDGKVIKTSVFKHTGFVPAFVPDEKISTIGDMLGAF